MNHQSLPDQCKRLNIEMCGMDEVINKKDTSHLCPSMYFNELGTMTGELNKDGHGVKEEQ